MKVTQQYKPALFRLYNMISHFVFMSLCMLMLLWQPVAYSQIRSSDTIAAITSLLLFDDQCPAATTATTLSGNRRISNQKDLDALQGARRIKGNLLFNTALTTLDFSTLDSLVEVTGNIEFDSTGLTVIDGFECISRIGGDLNILINNALTKVGGFAALSSIGGNLEFFSNAVLSRTPGFAALNSIGGFLSVRGNDALTRTPGFAALNSIGRYLNIASNFALTRITGFAALSNIGGGLFIVNNDALPSITGFAALTNVSGNIFVDKNQRFDCTNPVPTFVPVTSSKDNLVNCDLI